MSMLSAAVDLSERTPLDYVDWLPSQSQYLHTHDRNVLLRAGNQALGKTTVGVADTLWTARGEHPFRPVSHKPGIYWIVSSSEQQSGVLAGKLFKLCPPGWIHPASEWVSEKGHFRGKYPSIGIRHKSGGWSRIYFRWTGQRTLNLAGATLDGVLFDEPPATQRAFREVERRLTRTGGWLRMTLTPVNAPVDYLRELCDAGQVVDLHYSLTAENLIPLGRSEPLQLNDGTPMDAEWIAGQRALVLPWEAPVILDGEWEFRAAGQVFPAWDPALHVCRGRVVNSAGFPRHKVKLAVGIDYGDDTHRQVAVLCAIDDAGRYPRVWVLDEYASDGRTTTDQDADHILAMIGRHGIKWSELNFVHGDKRYMGRRGGITLKSNKLLHRAVGDALGMGPVRLSPPIHSAKRGKGAGHGAKYAGARWLHESMIREGHLLVDSRCKVVIEALGKWDWTESYKDPVDALRYCLKPWILGRGRWSGVHRAIRVG